MKDEQREQVLDNARYLREVRPLDPDEIHEYVEGQPHPAAVRQTLREHAPDLGLIEREDGTFVPVEEEPVSVDFDGVDEFPDAYARRVEDLLVERFGAGWPDGESGDRLRERIRDVKERYLRNWAVEYDDVTALGYAVYHLPTTYAEIQYVLADLAAADFLDRSLRVLDVGAGVGGPALGLHDLLPEDALVEYHAVEPSDAADVLTELLAETGRNFHATVHRETAEAFDPDRSFDLVLFANVLSELDEPAETATRYLDALADDGTLVALAPADRETAIRLRDVERALETEGATVYAPTLRLWPDERPAGECWSFDRKPDLAVPGFQRRLDAGERAGGSEPSDRPDAADGEREPGDGEFVNVDVQYAYSLLRTDGRERLDFTPDAEHVAKMAEMDDHVTDRIDCVAVKLSHDLGEENPLYLVGDGSEQVDHFAVLTEPSTLNRDLERADYGTVLYFENVLALWNDDEGAYNLVVEGETIVDRVG